MGLLSKLLATIRLPSAAAPATRPTRTPAMRGPAGPLRLATGDFVVHYRARFAVVGVRRLECEKRVVFQYCLRDENGATTVLVADDGPETALTLQRAIDVKVPWDVDALDDVLDEPFKLRAHGSRRVRAFDDAGVATGARSMEHREFRDASGDRVLVLEDYAGRRETRLGEVIFETELEFERATSTRAAGILTAALDADRFESAAEDEVVPGSPRAAAKALEENVGVAGARAVTTAAPDRDPTAYDDDHWTDERDEQTATSPRRRAAARAHVDEEDEWVDATQFLRDERTGDDAPHH
jgi:hypothetical protein